MPRFLRLFALSSILLGFVGGSSPLVQAHVDPSIKWKKLETEHFELIYDAHQQPLAHSYAERLEKIYQDLSSEWPKLPSKTITILNDRTDFTNGYATSIPYPHMMIFPALPSPTESVSEFDDWARELLIHEYTHVLSFEQRRGMVLFLSHIFGNIMTPNLLMSRYSLEGVAVEAETRLTRAGRLRSHYQDAVIRAFVLDDQWKKIQLSDINESSIPEWPFGARPYLFGSLLWSEMVAQNGKTIVGNFHSDMGGKFPYTSNSSLYDLSNKELEDYFSNMQLDVEKRVKAQLAKLGQVSFSKSVGLIENGSNTKIKTAHFLESFAPSVSPDGLKLAFLARNDDLKRSAQIWIRPSTEVAFSSAHAVKKLEGVEDENAPDADPKIPRNEIRNETRHDTPSGSSIQRLSWFPDSQSFVYDQIGELNPFEEFGELWIHDLKDKKSKRISTGLRGREPEVAPDGQKIAFAQVEGGRTHLALFDLATKKTTVLFTAQMQERVSFPTWLDANRIVFSLRTAGQDRLLLWQQGQATQQLLNDYPQVRFAQKIQNHLHFTSTKNGVQNLYRSDLNFQNIQTITHSPTSVFHSSYDPHQKEFFFSQMSSTGMQIHRLKEGEIPAADSQIPVIAGLFADRYPAQHAKAAPETVASTASVETSSGTQVGISTIPPSEDYAAWEYLRPRYWIPFIFWDDVSTKITVLTAAQDPLAKHSYSLSGAYDTTIKKWSGAAVYENKTLYPVIQTSYYDLLSPLAVSGESQRAQGGGISARWPFFFGKSEWSFSTAVVGTQRTWFTAQSKQWGPSFSINYSNTSQTAVQISPEAGGTFNFAWTPYQKGGDLQSFNLVSAGATRYFSKWLPKRHALMTRLQAQYIDQYVPNANLESSTSSASIQGAPSGYLMRGYVSGAFLGKSLVNTNLEYRFPLTNLYRGTKRALFFRRVVGAFVADGILLRGFVYDTKSSPPTLVGHNARKGFWNFGLEARLEMNLGYHFPMNFVAGAYFPTDTEYTASVPRFAFGLSL